MSSATILAENAIESFTIKEQADHWHIVMVMLNGKTASHKIATDNKTNFELVTEAGKWLYNKSKELR